jgi:hypothetical protein
MVGKGRNGMVKLALVGTAFVAVTFISVLASDGACARGGGGGHGSGGKSTGTTSGTAHYVQGYTRSNGTYVPGHYATNPNSTKLDNYSTKGNTNPWTGKPGTKSPYGSSSARRYYGPSGTGAAVPALSNPVDWGTSYPSAMQFAPGSSGSTLLSPSAVSKPYHPQWTVEVVH